MKVEMDDTNISIGFEDKSEHHSAFHTLSFFGEDSGEIVIYLSDKELQSLKERLEWKLTGGVGNGKYNK